MVKKVVILGAGGRDFHNFNVYYRDNPDVRVVAFTATQIPNIAYRTYPPELAGPLYPKGIPIYPEEDLERIIREYGVDEAVFSYSDVSHEHVMHVASRVLAAGASFTILGPRHTMLESSKPVISVCAVRTGSGKSPVSRFIASRLRARGHRVVVIRHPMPYGDLRMQAVQRFATIEDLDKHTFTLEEREDYEPHILQGSVVFSGVDYEKVLEEAEKEAGIILWDGGNNDLPFVKPDVHVVVVDPHRAGHELRYHPGEANLRMADVVVISKVNTARPEDVEAVERNVKAVNPGAQVVRVKLRMFTDEPVDLRGKKVLAVEDGPTTTHGEMKYGAAYLLAKQMGAEVVDPFEYTVGSVREMMEEYGVRGVLPAVGYGREQIEELEETIDRVPCDVVLLGTPTDIRRYMKVSKPVVRVRYEVEEVNEGELEEAVIGRLERLLPSKRSREHLYGPGELGVS